MMAHLEKTKERPCFGRLIIEKDVVCSSRHRVSTWECNIKKFMQEFESIELNVVTIVMDLPDEDNISGISELPCMPVDICNFE